MAKDLTTSAIERQNVLNNYLAIPRIQKALDIEAYHFEGKYYLTKQMVADFYEVDSRTIDNYLSSHEDELKHNGYFLCKGKRLKNFKLQSYFGYCYFYYFNEKAGGGTKYINWRDRDFLPAAIQEENYRKNLTAPINDYVDGHPTYKNASITDMIYKAVFHEMLNNIRNY